MSVRETPNESKLAQNQGRYGLLYSLGLVPYAQAWRRQQERVARYKQAQATVRDALLLLQHPPVYTLGQGADEKFLRFDPTVEDAMLYRIERGGEVTYHCPGQLVGYPILNLRHYQMDLHWYLRQLEEVLIQTLAVYGLAAQRVPGMTGVWIEGRKVAAIGIKVSRWITMHGFALNVCPELSGFEKIVPCGLEGKAVCSMAQFLPEIDIAAVEAVLVERFEQVFGLPLVGVDYPDAW